MRSCLDRKNCPYFAACTGCTWDRGRRSTSCGLVWPLHTVQSISAYPLPFAIVQDGPAVDYRGDGKQRCDTSLASILPYLDADAVQFANREVMRTTKL